MIRWWLAVLTLFAVAGLLSLLSWIRSRRSEAGDPLEIKPPRQRFSKLTADEANSMRDASAQRRARADHFRRDAAQTETKSEPDRSGMRLMGRPR
jgi:hypothetical protein